MTRKMGRPRLSPPTTFSDDHVKVLRHLDATGLSVEGCAEYMGISPHTMTKWRTGDRKPNQVALKLVEVYSTLRALDPPVYEAMLPK